MFVLTVDQIGSRRRGDLVPGLLDALARTGPLAGLEPSGDGPSGRGLVLAVDRTVGDEVQTLLDDPDLTVATVLHLLRLGEWSVGVGVGPVDRPLPEVVRAASGPAFVAAREAVDAAKSRARSLPLAVRGTDVQAAEDAQAVLTLLGALVRRRTPAGWEVVDRMLPDVRQEDVAASLGITQQAVSARLSAALWAEEIAARPAAARLLTRVGGDRDDG